MGDYSAAAHPNTIMQQRYGDATVQYQLAELTGVRFVGISETEREVQLEEAVVKQITGNDTISARSPYGRPFGYRPQFKIWLSTNHKPEIPDGSEAIWDRLRLIPFTQRFEGKKADTKLPAKLREELPGVLAWAVRGAVEWFAQGLGTSAAVEAATAEYRAETDTLEQFFADRCYFYPGARVTRKALFQAWEQWCDEEGEDPETQTKFTRRLNELRGVKKFSQDKTDKNTRAWRGISLSPPEVSEPQKSCKTEGRDDSSRHFTEKSPNFSGKGSRVGRFDEIGEKVSELPESVGGPCSWVAGELKIEYMPGESE